MFSIIWMAQFTFCSYPPLRYFRLARWSWSPTLFRQRWTPVDALTGLMKCTNDAVNYNAIQWRHNLLFLYVCSWLSRWYFWQIQWSWSPTSFRECLNTFRRAYRPDEMHQRYRQLQSHLLMAQSIVLVRLFMTFMVIFLTSTMILITHIVRATVEHPSPYL